MKYLAIFVFAMSIILSLETEHGHYEKFGRADEYISDGLIQALADTLGNDYATKYEQVGNLIDPNLLDVDKFRSRYTAPINNIEDTELHYNDIPQDTGESNTYIQNNKIFWGDHNHVSGGSRAGESKHKTQIPSDKKNTAKSECLPAYCDPPNPCPRGYRKDSGCLEEFENTATFSREYQEAQLCMCDVEHMLKCPKKNPTQHHAAGVRYKKQEILAEINPFLEGEGLPTAAKKGFNIPINN